MVGQCKLLGKKKAPRNSNPYPHESVDTGHACGCSARKAHHEKTKQAAARRARPSWSLSLPPALLPLSDSTTSSTTVQKPSNSVSLACFLTLDLPLPLLWLASTVEVFLPMTYGGDGNVRANSRDGANKGQEACPLPDAYPVAM
jgi:hypothetical protein